MGKPEITNTPALVSSCTPTPSGREGKRRFFALTRAVARICLAPFFEIRTQGLEHLPDRDAFVLLPKHQRWEDIPILAIASRRQLHYAAKYELFINPLSGWLLSALGGIPLNRSRPLESRRGMRKMIEVIQNGEGLVVFPEGTYVQGNVGPGRAGLVKLIRSRLKVAFFPVGIQYSKGRRNLVRITFGASLPDDPLESTESFIGRAMREIARLSGLE